MQPWKGAQQQIAFIKNSPRDCLRDQKTTTKKRVHAESVSVITRGWKRTVSSEYEHCNHMKRPTFSLHLCHLFITLTYSWYLYGTIFFSTAAWWGCDCSYSFKFFKDEQAYKSCSSYPHWQFSTFKFMLPLFLESHILLYAKLWSHRRFYGAIPLGQDEMRRQAYGFFTSHWVSLFSPWLLRRCDSAWWLCEDIKMAIWDMLMLVSQLSFWKHKTAVAQAFDDTSLQPKRFSGLMLQRREWDQKGSSVWQGAFWRSGGPWKNDPTKCITSSCYHPAPPPTTTTTSWSWFMMNLADLLAVNQKGNQALFHPLLLFFPFSNDFCVTYVKPDV